MRIDLRVPDAVQREAKRNGAPLIRDRQGTCSYGPGSAAHHSVVRRARGKNGEESAE